MKHLTLIVLVSAAMAAWATGCAAETARPAMPVAAPEICQTVVVTN